MKNKKNKCVIPYSGGMDSTVMLYDAYYSGLYDEIYCIFFNYNQRHITEKQMFNWNIKHLNKIRKNNLPKVFKKEINISFLKNISPKSCLTNNKLDIPDGSNYSSDKTPKSYVPNRNMILISIAASFAESIEATDVYHGAVAADLEGGYWDCTPNFFKYLNKTFKVSNGDIKINVKTPLINLSKKEIILKGIKLGVDFAHTWTDYSGGKQGIIEKNKFISLDNLKNFDKQDKIIYAADAETASSKCRIQGFIDAHLIDPLPYQQNLSKLWKTNNCSTYKI